MQSTESFVKAPDDLRRRLLDASLALIAAEGLEGFSMREVARRAGVSHQAPYHHFPDREAILAAIVAEGFMGLRESTQTAGRGISDPHAYLTAVGKAYIRFAIAHPAHFKLMFRSEWVSAEKHDEAKACAQGAFEVLANAIRAVDPRAERDPTILLMAWSMAHGLATLLLEGKLAMSIGPDPEAQAAAAEAVLDRWQTMLRAGLSV